MAILIKKQAADGTAMLVPLQPPTPPIQPLPNNLFTMASPEVISKATQVVNSELEALAAFQDKPAVVVHNLFEEALAESATPAVAPALQPWEIDPGYSILVALAEFAAKKFPNKTLRIIHRTMPTHSYVVKEYDPGSGRAKLVGGFKGGTLKPVITEREETLYYPVWN